MKRLIALAFAFAAFGGGAAARADGEPVDTTSPYAQCSPDVCDFAAVPPPQFRTDGFFEGRAHIDSP